MDLKFLRPLLLASTALCPVAAMASDTVLPSGAQVSHGDVAIRQSGPAMEITQGSGSAIVNWRDFSIGAGGSVDIRQPGAGAAMLNRVTGDATSEIHGRLTATGQVHLVNPNGIVIGPSGRVEAAGFTASTLDMRDEDFLAGQARFRGDGRSAAVRNHGTIDILPGGYAALIGGQVENAGTIRVPRGRVGLAAGEEVLLDLAGDRFLQVTLPSGATDDEEALIAHSGRIEAGRVEIEAATARDAARHAINLSGVVEAQSVSGRNGAVILGGGPGGQVTVSGRVSARAPVTAAVETSPVPPARPTGGEITVTGAEIVLTGATLDASGPGGGGEIRIGGDLMGGGSLPRARSLSVDTDTTITADALTQGDGGLIVLWSDAHTAVDGSLAARGGPQGGDGGFVEVSAQQVLAFRGSADTRAPQGRRGTLLLDPSFLVIAQSEAGFEPPISVVLVDDLARNLEISDVTLTAEIPPGGDPLADGSILLLDPLAWSSSSRLSLIADNSIFFLAPLRAPAGSVQLVADLGISLLPGGTIEVDASSSTVETGSVIFFKQIGEALDLSTAAILTFGEFGVLQAASEGAAAGAPEGIYPVTLNGQPLADLLLNVDNVFVAVLELGDLTGDIIGLPVPSDPGLPPPPPAQPAPPPAPPPVADGDESAPTPASLVAAATQAAVPPAAGQDDFEALEALDEAAADEAADRAEETLTGVRAGASVVEWALRGCDGLSAGAGLLDCVAGALEEFSGVLDQLADGLAPELQDVSAVIRNAQVGVRDISRRAATDLATAATDAERAAIERRALDEALGVVRGTTGEVRRTISLIRADDPQLVSVFNAQGDAVVAALEAVETELVRAIGL